MVRLAASVTGGLLMWSSTARVPPLAAPGVRVSGAAAAAHGCDFTGSTDAFVSPEIKSDLLPGRGSSVPQIRIKPLPQIKARLTSAHVAASDTTGGTPAFACFSPRASCRHDGLMVRERWPDPLVAACFPAVLRKTPCKRTVYHPSTIREDGGAGA